MIKKLLVYTAATLVVANSYAAIDAKDYAACSAIKGDLERLECFDELSEKNKLDGPQPVQVDTDSIGKWEVSSDVNPIDDSKTVFLALYADSGENRWGDKVFMVARCKSNKTDFYIGWNDYLGGKANVLARVGDKKASTSEWSMSSTKKATFHPQPVELLKEMLESTTFVAQVTPYNENPITAIFNTSGLNNAIKPLRETCNW